jgi:hypothetical protein
MIYEIAEILADVWPPTNAHCGFDSGNHSTSLGWITVTHVCQTLRYIFISHQALWAKSAHILAGEAQSEMLDRAGTHPVSFVIPKGQCFHTASRVQTMLDNLSRAGKLVVSDNEASRSPESVDKWPLAAAVLSDKSLPFLRHLEISLSSHLSYEKLTSDFFALPPVDAPDLRYLLLFSIYIPFKGHTLAILQLGFTKGMPHPRPTASHLFDMLRSYSQLRELSLWNMIPSDATLTSDSTILFPDLVELDIVDDFDHAVALWSHIKAPPTAFYRFTLRSTTVDRLDVLEQRIKSMIDPFKIRLMSAGSHGSFLNLAFSTASPPPDEPYSAPQLLEADTFHCLHVTLMKSEAEVDAFPLDMIVIVQRMAETLDLAVHLEYLRLPWAIARDVQRGALRPLSRLRTLHLYSKSADGDTRILLDLLQITPSPFLPALQHLWITSMYFGPQDLDDFVGLLAERVRAGCGIRGLKIEALVNDGAEAVSILSRLKEMVPDVQCNSLPPVADVLAPVDSTLERAGPEDDDPDDGDEIAFL